MRQRLSLVFFHLLEFSSDIAPNTSDVMLSYLPMCYTLERCCQMVTVLGGGVGTQVKYSSLYKNF